MTFSYLSETLRPEARLILACSNVALDTGGRRRLESALNDDVDWATFVRIATQQGIEPLIYKHLNQYVSAVPKSVLRAVAASASYVSFRSREKARELSKLVTYLEGRGIPVIPFKGPVLAESVYGSAAYRACGDLDLFVKRDDLLSVKEVLLSRGYDSYRQLTADEEAEYLDTQLGYEFFHPDGETVVELHWSLFYTAIGIDLAPEALWERHVEIPFADRSVRSFAPEDLLIYLCAHGTKHRWAQVKWLADVAALVRTHPDLNWRIVEERARGLGCLRMTHLGLHLAEELLDAPVPADMSRAASGNPAVGSLARQVTTQWMFSDPDAAEDGSLDDFLFHWRERERFRDRMPLLRHNLGLWIKPSEKDRSWVDLPSSLSFVYYFARPIRLLLEKVQWSRRGED